MLENNTIDVGTIKARGIYIDDQDLVCKNDPTQTAELPLPRAGTDFFQLNIPLADNGKLVQDESHAIPVFNDASSGAAPFEFTTMVEPSLDNIPGVSLSPTTTQSVAAGGVPANVTFRITQDYDNKARTFRVKFVGTDGKQAAMQTLQVATYVTKLPPRPQCGEVPCPNPTSGGGAGPGVIRLEKPFPWIAWIVVVLAVIVAALSGVAAYWWWRDVSSKSKMDKSARNAAMNVGRRQ